MNIRTQLEEREKNNLSEFACLSTNTRGRLHPMDKCSLRTEFQRDRDRILHSRAFRRLKFKTQVFLSPKEDHLRTRLTHTLEVAQVARTIARALRLNEDLTEAIALGHDLGHTPYGHNGEYALNRLLNGGFRHNDQSLRVVDKIERDGQGLNLTFEVRDGILNHSGSQEPITLEGMCVRKADRIAYINHDIEDSIRAGILRESDLPKHCLNVLGYSHGKRIENMISNIVSNSINNDYISMSKEFQEASDELRTFMFKNVYRSPEREDEERKCDFVIRSLFVFFVNAPKLMPAKFQEIAHIEGVERAVADYIASMTDRYATHTFESLFVPSAFSNTTKYTMYDTEFFI